MNRTSTRRLGFTLIEVLVVIAIIAILAALLLGGVMAFMGKGPETRTRSDISQLSIALDKFKADKGAYPPSQIVLKPRLMDYVLTNPIEADSVYWITKFWPNIPPSAAIPWGGASTPAAAVLAGDQCLVFFLGGPPVGGGQPGLLGFSNDPQNPANPALPDRKKYYEFEVARLYSRDGGPFLSYKDGWGKAPYVYFSSGRRDDNYSTAVNTTGVIPYFKNPPAPPPMVQTGFHNPSKFQLISAGPDGAFGPGGFWNGSTPAGGNGKDDVSNFHDKALGNP